MAEDNNFGERQVTWPKVILFGDSLTQQCFSDDGCWGSLLADHVVRKCDVVNRGFSGYTTRPCKTLLPRVIGPDTAREVALFLLFLGANDSNDPVLNPKQHVPLAEFTQNLIQMVDYLQSVGVGRERIVLITPPPVEEEKWAERAREKHNSVSGKTQSLTERYAQAVSDTARKCGVDVVDLFSNMIKQKEWKGFLSDGLHFSRSGSVFVFEALRAAVDQRTAQLPSLFPDWKDLDRDNPAETLLRV